MGLELPVQAQNRARARACQQGRQGAAGLRRWPADRPARSVERERWLVFVQGKRVTRLATRRRLDLGRASKDEEACCRYRANLL